SGPSNAQHRQGPAAVSSRSARHPVPARAEWALPGCRDVREEPPRVAASGWSNQGAAYSKTADLLCSDKAALTAKPTANTVAAHRRICTGVHETTEFPSIWKPNWIV